MARKSVPYGDFAPYYDLVYGKSVDYAGDVRILEEAFGKHARGEVKRILDLGAGTASHAIRLAARGYEVDGVEISPGLLRIARKKVAESRFPKRVRLHGQDMSRLQVEGEFDAAICMFGAFGYLTTEEEIEGFFAGVAERVRPGGLLAFEFWNPLGLVLHNRWDDAAEGDMKVYRMHTARFEARESVYAFDMHVVVVDGKRVVADLTEEHRLRLHLLADVRARLARHGFDLVALGSASPDGKSWDEPPANEFRVMVCARRRARPAR